MPASERVLTNLGLRKGDPSWRVVASLLVVVHQSQILIRVEVNIIRLYM